MISLSPSNVPEYLRSGDFFLSLDQTTDEFIQVACDVVKPNLVITNTNDLTHALSSLRFWGVTDLPYELMDYYLDVVQDYSCTLHFEDAFPALDVLQAVEQTRYYSTMTDTAETIMAIQLGSLYVLKYLVNRGYELEDHATVVAAKFGRLDILHYLTEQGYLCHNSTIEAALQEGHIECLEFLRQYLNIPGDMQTLSAHFWFAGHFDLRTIKNVLNLGCFVPDALLLDYAAKHGLPEMLKYGVEELGLRLGKDTVGCCVDNGHLDCLQYVHSLGLPWKSCTSRRAAYAGQWPCLKFALEKGCPYDDEVFVWALKRDQVECVRVLHEFDGRWCEDFAIRACMWGAVNCLVYGREYGCLVNNEAHAFAVIYAQKTCAAYLEACGVISDVDISFNLT